MNVGVPDSKLKEWLADKKYIVASDEGEAVAIGVGHYLSTGETPTIFMGTDGFSNAINALTTLVTPYKIPIELVVGVREDEPIHSEMGKKFKSILDIINDKGNISIEIIE